MFLKGMVQDAVVHVAQKVKCVKARGEAIVSRAHAVGSSNQQETLQTSRVEWDDERKASKERVGTVSLHYVYFQVQCVGKSGRKRREREKAQRGRQNFRRTV